MRRSRALRGARTRLLLLSTVAAGAAGAAFTQDAARQPLQTPRDYRGPQVRVPGIFMTPVPNAPFTARVQIVSHHPSEDGTDHVTTTVNHVARNSAGRIRNERRQMVTAAFRGDPPLLSVLLYDPSSRLSISLDPFRRLARETTLRAPATADAGERPPVSSGPGISETSLGEKTMEGLPVQGLRKSRVVPADLSGTGKPVTITDDYWFSPALSIYLAIQHNDPRTGEQLVVVTDIVRQEPPAEMLVVPPEYKVVDETTPEAPVSAR